MELDMQVFAIRPDGTIKIRNHKETLRTYAAPTDRVNYTDQVLYFSDDEIDGWKDRYVAKHQLLEIVKEEEVDMSDISWMDGIKLHTNNKAAEIRKIYSYGSLEAYESTLEEAQDLFKCDIDERITKLELGL